MGKRNAITAPEAPAPEAPEVTPSPTCRIKMLTTSAGPEPLKNWNEGQKRTVGAEEAAALVNAGFAEYL